MAAAYCHGTAAWSNSSTIDAKWDDSQPIYRQLRDRVVAMMLEGILKEGEAMPSVRQVATEYRLNPLTVLKAYQQLVGRGAGREASRPRHVRRHRAPAPR